MCSPSLTYPSSFCSLLAYYLCKYIHPTLRTHLHICRLWSISTITCCMSRVFFHAVNSRMPVLFGISPNNSWPLFSFLVICSSTTEVSTPLSLVAPPPPLPPQKCLSLECVPPYVSSLLLYFLKQHSNTKCLYMWVCTTIFCEFYFSLTDLKSTEIYFVHLPPQSSAPQNIYSFIFRQK